MSVMERARAHFDSLRNLSIEVPEWQCRVYFDRPSVARNREIEAQCKDRTDAWEVAVRLVVACAREEDGSPMFKREDVQLLMRGVDPEVLSRVALAIRGEKPDVEELIKNSEPTHGGSS